MQWKHVLQICLIIFKYNKIALLWEDLSSGPSLRVLCFTKGQWLGHRGVCVGLDCHSPPPHSFPSAFTLALQINIQSKSKPYVCYVKAAWRCLRTRLWSQGPPKQKSWCHHCQWRAMLISSTCSSWEQALQQAACLLLMPLWALRKRHGREHRLCHIPLGRRTNWGNKALYLLHDCSLSVC